VVISLHVDVGLFIAITGVEVKAVGADDFDGGHKWGAGFSQSDDFTDAGADFFTGHQHRGITLGFSKAGLGNLGP
jgi:hypothetical protein